MQRNIRYSLVFDSPLMISSGVSLPGVYDRITTLDDDGLPCVPASSIRGRVKDAIRGFLLDNINDWGWFRLCKGQAVSVDRESFVAGSQNVYDYCQEQVLCVLCRIFGAPGGRKRSYEFSGAYYSDEAAENIKSAFGDTEASTASLSRRARNKRDDKLRRALKDHLFIDGVAEMMAELEGTVREKPAHLRFDERTRDFDHRLLLLGLRLTTELSACRNRGYGHCEFSPANDDNWMPEIEALITDWETARGTAS